MIGWWTTQGPDTLYWKTMLSTSWLYFIVSRWFVSKLNRLWLTVMSFILRCCFVTWPLCWILGTFLVSLFLLFQEVTKQLKVKSKTFLKSNMLSILWDFLAWRCPLCLYAVTLLCHLHIWCFSFYFSWMLKAMKRTNELIPDIRGHCHKNWTDGRSGL